MIYLIKIYGKDQEAYKIGYTEDHNYKTRMYAYESHNPFTEIIHTIPGGTEIHEKKLHLHFKKYLLFKNEWFKCEQEIIDYIKTVTLKELDELPELGIRPIEVKRLRKVIRISYDVTQKKGLDNYKDTRNELIKKCSKCTITPFNDDYIFSKFDLLEEDINFVIKRVNGDYSDLPENLIEPMKSIDNEGEFTKKMRLLCEYEFTDEELDYILKQLPSEFAKYYYTLGPEKIKAVLYRKYLLEDAYNKLMFNTTTMINDIYNIFNEGDKLTTQEIIEQLISIYDKCNNPNRPKATDIKDYFEVGRTKKTITLPDGEKVVKDGFKLIKKLH